MNKNNIVAWVLAFGIVTLTVLGIVFAEKYDEVDVLELNYSSLPANGSFNLTLVAFENSTVYLDQFVFNDFVNLSYPSFVWFNSTNQSVVSIDYVVDYNVSANVSLKVALRGNNSFTNRSFTYGMIFNISDDFLLINESEVFDVKILNDDYFVNITTNLLPRNGSFSYRVTGLPGERANLSCGGWLSCPGSILFNGDGVSEFKISYFIPEDASIGVHLDYLNVSAGNKTRSSKVEYLISHPEVSIFNYVWGDDCFTVDEDGQSVVMRSCLEEFQDYQFNTWQKILRLSQQESNLSCQNTTIIETEYVVTGSVEKETHDELMACRGERDSYLSNYKTCSSDLLIFSDDLDDCKENLLSNKSELMASTFIKSVELKKEADMRVKRTNRLWTLIIISVIALLSLIAWLVNWYFRVYQKNKWRFG